MSSYIDTYVTIRPIEKDWTVYYAIVIGLAFFMIILGALYMNKHYDTGLFVVVCSSISLITAIIGLIKHVFLG